MFEWLAVNEDVAADEPCSVGAASSEKRTICTYIDCRSCSEQSVKKSILIDILYHRFLGRIPKSEFRKMKKSDLVIMVSKR